MDAEKQAMQRRIDNLQQHIDRLHGALNESERKNAKLTVELEAVKRERDAAIRDCARFPCYTCNEREIGDCCPQCRTTGTFRTLHEWRGLCKENGGKQDDNDI